MTQITNAVIELTLAGDDVLKTNSSPATSARLTAAITAVNDLDLTVLDTLVTRLRALGFGAGRTTTLIGNDTDVVAVINDLWPRLGQFGLPLRTFTVGVQQADGRGATHIDSYKAYTVSDARTQALNGTLDDWGSDYTVSDLRVLFVAVGEITLAEWNDMDGGRV